MTRRSTAARILFLVVAAVQLLLPPVAAWADAATEREAASRGMPYVHVEAQTANECARIHPADCALCHATCTTFTRTTPEPLLLVTRRTAEVRPADSRIGASTPSRAWGARPRAPPALS